MAINYSNVRDIINIQYQDRKLKDVSMSLNSLYQDFFKTEIIVYYQTMLLQQVQVRCQELKQMKIKDKMSQILKNQKLNILLYIIKLNINCMVTLKNQTFLNCKISDDYILELKTVQATTFKQVIDALKEILVG